MDKQTTSLEKKFIILTITFVLFMITVLPVFLTFLIKIIPGSIQPSLTTTKKIYQEYAYYQSFISPEENLAGIGVSIKNPNFINKKTLYFNLYDDRNKVSRTITLNGQSIADGKFVRIFFEPVRNSKKQMFSWFISSPDSTVDDAMEIFLTDQFPKWSLELKTKSEVFDRNFSYVTLHKPTSLFDVFNRVLTTWSAHILADSIFFVCWAILVTLLLLLIVTRKPFKYKQ